jgi:hypothetical protein
MTKTIGSPGKSLDWPELDFHPFAGARPGALGRIGTAAVEGFQGAPAIPLAPANAPAGFFNPFVTGINTLLGGAGAVIRGGQQTVQESIDPMFPGLGRDIAAGLEAFPTGPRNQIMPHYEPLPTGAPPRPAADYMQERYGETLPATMRGKFEGAGEPLPQPGEPAPPPAPPPPTLPPVPDGSVRLYHGGSDPTSGGARWVTPDYTYARDWTAGGPVSYVDVPRNHPAVQDHTDPGTASTAVSGASTAPRIGAFEAPEDIAKQLRPVEQPASAGAAAAQPAPAAPPVVPAATAAGEAPIMSAADIQARARGYYSGADQAAAQGSMLPDVNAAAVRKIFSDAIPSDEEQARIAAGRPSVQAASNVSPSGPMSYDTAMMIDRDLTERLRGASGSDRSDLGKLQTQLRDQMDQVPELDSLAAGRQAYKQYIKQSQVEDINYGASLKNDPAAADAYVRQRAAALLKNDNQIRNWDPDERAQLEAVARSGDIGMLGRLTASLIKPATRVAFGALGHTVAGPLGAIVGAEVGGDIGATQAAKLRSYLSKTTLDDVSRQITQGVPPPPANQLLPP